MWDNPVNLSVIAWLGQYSQLSPKFNHAVNYIAHANVFKGLPMLALVWYFWFKDTDARSGTRKIIIGTLLAIFVALLLATVINYLMPFQPTPVANDAAQFQVPIGLEIDKTSLGGHGWLNSFPSHHATMFFALATGIFLISRPAGCFAFLYVILFIAMPRIYLGLHYVTDILAGAVLGILTAILMTRTPLRRIYEAPAMRLLDTHPATFQALLFILTFEMAVLFSDAINLIKGVAEHAL